MQSFSNPSKLLQRNESLFENSSILVAGNIDDSYPLALEKLASTATFCFNDFRHFSALKNKFQRAEGLFTENYQGDKKFDLLLIYIPKAKQEIQYLLANLTPHLTENASILLVGEKKCGIKSVNNLLAPYSSHVNAIDSARHCSLIYCELTKTVPAFIQDDWIKTFTIDINNISIKVKSFPGVFSHGTLDKGTELLLQSLPTKMKGAVLDFGCGAGIIASYVKMKHPDVLIDLVDVNVYALASAKLTLKSNSLDGNVFPSNVFSDIEKTYNTLLSNPPFHSGKNTDYTAAEGFIQLAPQYLQARGELIIVANKFLKYEPLLTQAFANVSTPVSCNKFKILTCIKEIK